MATKSITALSNGTNSNSIKGKRSRKRSITSSDDDFEDQDCVSAQPNVEPAIPASKRRNVLEECLMNDGNKELIERLLKENEELKKLQTTKTTTALMESSASNEIEFELETLDNPNAPVQSAMPSTVVQYMEKVQEKLPEEITNLHWYSLYICLPRILSIGASHPMVPKIAGEKEYNGKATTVADPIIVGPTVGTAWNVKKGFQVCKSDKERLVKVFPDITRLQTFAKAIGDNKTTAVWFHREGKYAQTKSHYHIIIGLPNKWETMNIKNEITQPKFAGLGFKRFKINNLAGTLVHHCQPRTESQFIGATDSTLLRVIKSVTGQWIKNVGEMPTIRLYNGIGEIAPEYEEASLEDCWKTGETSGSSLLVEAGRSLQRRAMSQTIIINDYKKVLSRINFTIYTIDQIQVSLTRYMKAHPEEYLYLRTVFCKDKGYVQRMSLMQTALDEMAMERIEGPIKDITIPLLSKASDLGVKQLIAVLEDGIIMHLLDLIVTAAVILKKTGKMNAIYVHGKRNAGKSTIFGRSLEWLAPQLRYKRTQDPDVREFCFQDLVHPQFVVIMDEFGLFPVQGAEAYKVLLGGQSMPSHRKHKGDADTFICPFILMANESLKWNTKTCPHDYLPLETRVHQILLREGEMPNVTHSTQMYCIFWQLLLTVVNDLPAPFEGCESDLAVEHYVEYRGKVINDMLQLLSDIRKTSSICEIYTVQPESTCFGHIEDEFDNNESERGSEGDSC